MPSFLLDLNKMPYVPSIPLAPVTLDDVKAHLRIDFDFEDGLIEQYILAATQIAEQALNREILFRSDDMALARSIEEVPPTVKQFILCEVGDMYAHRELNEQGTYNVFHKHLLDPYVMYNRPVEEKL